MITELLAPAGDLEKLKIAILYGADAVYLAGQQFSLRSAAGNFSIAEIKAAIAFAHQRGKKIYITVNAFLHDNELDLLPDYLKTLNSLQPDGLICSDLGVVSLATQHTTIPVHISTQASVINSGHAQIWKDHGAKRVVVGRELSIVEASKIKHDTGLEVEMFIHGAMCMAYSGHCAMSTYVAQRDANRGGCIQNCRFKYTLFAENQPIQHSHLLSSKDLCGFELLRQFVDAGIDSIKIEGRMKSNLYIASTVRVYANALLALTEGKTVDSETWQQELEKIPYRGYTTASLENDARLDSVYHPENNAGKDYKMAGTVLEVDEARRRFAFQVKNKLTPGDMIEMMPFRGRTIQLPIVALTNLADQELEVAQPNNVIWLPWQPGIKKRNVARIHYGGPNK